MADDAHRARRRSPRSDPRTALRTAVVWDTVADALTELSHHRGRPVLDVVDLGGGTGGLAVPLARNGHRVTVVDSSPDALAALQRRAAEAGISHLVRAEQGDAAALGDIVTSESADLLLCHGVLEHVEDPDAVVTAGFRVLRPGGMASVVVAQRLGAVLARALSGRFDEAREVLEDPAGRCGATDPLLRRFDERDVRALLETAGGRVRAVRGVRLFVDLLPGALAEADPEAARALVDLEVACADNGRYPELARLASQLHVLAYKS